MYSILDLSTFASGTKDKERKILGMAKKKGKARPRKGKKKRTSSFVSSVKMMFLGAFAVVVCFIGVLFIYNWFYPVSETRPAKKKQERTESVVRPKAPGKDNSGTSGKKAGRATKPKKEASTYTFQEGTEIPRLKNKQKEQIIKHEGYTVSYNSDYRIANWVAYELTSKEATSKKSRRSNKFVSDPMVKGATATNEDYTRSGYDRGHMAPAGDMKWSAKAMRESFYLSNICPQKPGLNRGIWKDLEEQARLWAKENGSLLIVTGPVITDDLRRLGKNRVGIPKTFYKVICTIANGKPEGVGFLFDNKDYGKTSLKSMMIPIDSVEKVTGIDFFFSLPDSIENPVEAYVNDRSWSF